VITPGNLAMGASNSLNVGLLDDIDSGFKGSAIVQSDALLVATLVQLPQSTYVRVRPLSNGFSGGSPVILLATVLKNQFNSTSIFSVQNTDSEDNNIVIKFYNTSAVNVHTINTTIAPGASYYVDAGTITQLGTSFNGSAVIEATRSGGGDGSIVGSVLELSTNDAKARAFESVAEGARTIYLASAMCNAFKDPVTGEVSNSNFAVQNTSLTAKTNVTVTYLPGNETETKEILAGSKQSFNACEAGNDDGWFGSAVVTSSATDVVAMGKIAGRGASTAYLGEAIGSPRLSLPYVRWTETQWESGKRQRTTIAIQNIGDVELPAGSVTISYVDLTGATWTDTNDAPIPVGEKFNTSPLTASGATTANTEFGYVGSNFGGGAIVECSAANCELLAIARVATRFNSQNVAEDYNAIAVP
jgi:hypothetical protein